MNNLSELYFNIQSRLFPMVEEEIGELTAKLQETAEIVMLMMKCYHQDQPDLDNMPHPAWLFRIKV